jgi:hypothetical protein
MDKSMGVVFLSPYIFWRLNCWKKKLPKIGREQLPEPPVDVLGSCFQNSPCGIGSYHPNFLLIFQFFWVGVGNPNPPWQGVGLGVAALLEIDLGSPF